MKLIKQIPNLITLGNLFLGILALIYILESSELWIIQNLIKAKVELIPTSPDYFKLITAAAFVFIAAILDFLDGFIARFLKADTAIGKELDSLADVVTFGVVPGMFMYKLFEHAYRQNTDAIDTQWVLFLPAFLLTLCAAYRLAKFNVEKKESNEFKGLPTPAMALFVVALPYFIITNSEIGELLLYQYQGILSVNAPLPLVLLGITAILSYLMVSNVPMIALKFKGFQWKGNEIKYIFLLLALILIIIFALTSIVVLALPFIIAAYILLSIVTGKFRRNEIQS